MLCAQVIVLRDALVEELKSRGETEEAKKVAEFKGSKGYIELWKQRKNLTQVRLCGESGSVDQEKVTIEREKLNELLDEYSFSDVYNLDESALSLISNQPKQLGNKVTRASKS